jgi:hypothetical protein
MGLCGICLNHHSHGDNPFFMTRVNHSFFDGSPKNGHFDLFFVLFWDPFLKWIRL